MTWAMRAWEHDEMKVDVHVDSESAKGCGRKSMSGGMMIKGTAVKHWSRTQAKRALCTTEAEYYAVITGAAVAHGMRSTMTDVGLSAQVRFWTDSNAAKAIASRRSFGKTRHVEMKFLWLQR